jgi:hypothetical protein
LAASASLNRFAVSSWMPLKYDPDGSLTIYIQNERPGAGKEAIPAQEATLSPGARRNRVRGAFFSCARPGSGEGPPKPTGAWREVEAPHWM